MRRTKVIDRLLHLAAACNWECYAWLLAADSEADEADARGTRSCEAIDEAFWAIVAPLESHPTA